MSDYHRMQALSLLARSVLKFRILFFEYYLLLRANKRDVVTVVPVRVSFNICCVECPILYFSLNDTQQ
jgi:hypothetical protein